MSKTILLTTAFLFNAYFVVWAQEDASKTEDAVYLKNGTIIRGAIIENKANDKLLYVKQTNESGRDTVISFKRENVIQIKKNIPVRENELKAYNEKSKTNPAANRQNFSTEKPLDISLSGSMNKSMKMQELPMQVKEEKPIYIQRQEPAPSLGEMLGEKNEDIDLFAVLPSKRHRKRWFRQVQGPRFFLDQGFTFGLGKESNNRADWYVSGGYQFNPIFYTGVGGGYSLSLNNKKSSVPVFINPRINFLDENTTPYLDLKGGYSFVEGKGIYFSSTIGMSFSKGKHAFNIGAGYTFQKAKTDQKVGDNTDQKQSVKIDYHGISVKFTYEF